MLQVAIGPQRSYPSWQWVGEHLISELPKFYKVSTWSDFNAIPKCDICISVKQPFPYATVKALKNNKVKLIYCPIDFFESKEQIRNHASSLNSLDLILSHSERIMRLLKNHAPVAYVNHHGKYFLDEMASYKKDGYVLWIGGFQHTPVLVNWLNKNPINYEVKILSDIKNPSAVRRAELQCGELKVNFKDIYKYQLYEWSEKLQTSMMQEAKAALDIKGDYFAQQNRPPTKAQKFVCSGLPFAVNSSESFDYFKDKGFMLALPTNTAKWFSEEYWASTVNFGKKLKNKLTSAEIALEYKRNIDWLLAQSQKKEKK